MSMTVGLSTGKALTDAGLRWSVEQGDLFYYAGCFEHSPAIYSAFEATGRFNHLIRVRRYHIDITLVRAYCTFLPTLDRLVRRCFAAAEGDLLLETVREMAHGAALECPGIQSSSYGEDWTYRLMDRLGKRIARRASLAPDYSWPAL